MAHFLIGKSVSYGNSAFQPVRICSNAPILEQFNVRIDDKLSRLFHGKEYAGDDTLKDLVGYWLLREAYILWEKRQGDVNKKPTLELVK